MKSLDDNESARLSKPTGMDGENGESRSGAIGNERLTALAETAWNQAQITTFQWGEDLTSALQHGQQALSLARTGHDQELEARCLYTLGGTHLLRGDFEEAMSYTQASLAANPDIGSGRSHTCFLLW